MPIRTTHTYAILEVAPETFDDIQLRLAAAGGAEYIARHHDVDSEFGNVLHFGPVGFVKERPSPVGAPPREPFRSRSRLQRILDAVRAGYQAAR